MPAAAAVPSKFVIILIKLLRSLLRSLWIVLVVDGWASECNSDFISVLWEQSFPARCKLGSECLYTAEAKLVDHAQYLLSESQKLLDEDWPIVFYFYNSIV